MLQIASSPAREKFARQKKSLHCRGTPEAPVCGGFRVFYCSVPTGWCTRSQWPMPSVRQRSRRRRVHRDHRWRPRSSTYFFVPQRHVGPGPPPPFCGTTSWLMASGRCAGPVSQRLSSPATAIGTNTLVAVGTALIHTCLPSGCSNGRDTAAFSSTLLSRCNDSVMMQNYILFGWSA